jgi:hypothetical protein
LRSDRERLFDILGAVERIEAQAARGRAAFGDDELAQTAVIRWVEGGADDGGAAADPFGDVPGGVELGAGQEQEERRRSRGAR